MEKFSNFKILTDNELGYYRIYTKLLSMTFARQKASVPCDNNSRNKILKQILNDKDISVSYETEIPSYLSLKISERIFC